MAHDRYAERQQANDRAKAEAENHNQIWDAEEDALILETMDEPLEDVAYVLGRTIFATDMRRSVVRRRGLEARESYERTRNARARATFNYGETCPRCGLVHRGEC